MNRSLFVHDISRCNDAIDYILLGTLVLAASLFAYHPYFFGDELGSLYVASSNGTGFWSVFNALNTYKPRLLFNALWAAFAVAEVPRWVAMTVYAAALAAVASTIFYFARQKFNASRGVAWLAAMTLITSRFGVMLYYDYLAGIIETCSLALFLGGLLLVMDLLADAAKRQWHRYALLLLLITAAVFVHERYLAGVAALGGSLLLRGIGQAWQGHGWRQAVLGVVIALTPILLFAVATKMLAEIPLTTGTAGMPVQLNSGTFQVFATYLANVFLGTNFGDEWFVGRLNLTHPHGPLLFACLGGLLLIAWLVPLRWNSQRTKALVPVLMLGLLILSMIAVASLPGPTQQTARWMFPVGALIVLFTLAGYRAYARITLLFLLLGTNLIYLGLGSHRSIAHISASRSARELATALNTIIPPGRRGLILQAPQPDTSWILAGGRFLGNPGTSGEVFCHLNLTSGVCVDLPSSADKPDISSYGFGLLHLSFRESGLPAYRVISVSSMKALLAAEQLPAEGVGDAVGHGTNWTEWRWSQPPLIGGDGVLLKPGLDGHRPLDAQNLNERLIVYRAHAEGETWVPMRLQINWHDAQDRFLGALIKVVDVSPQTQNFVAIVAGPPKAAMGYVYATLHHGAQGSVILESVRLFPAGLDEVSTARKVPTQ